MADECKASNPFTCRVHGTQLLASVLKRNAEPMFMNIREHVDQLVKNKYLSGSLPEPITVPKEMLIARLWAAENREGGTCFIAGTPLPGLMNEARNDRLYHQAALQELMRLGYQEKDILLWQHFRVPLKTDEPTKVNGWQATKLYLQVEKDHNIRFPMKQLKELTEKCFRFSAHPGNEGAYSREVLDSYITGLLETAAVLQRRHGMHALN